MISGIFNGAPGGFMSLPRVFKGVQGCASWFHGCSWVFREFHEHFRGFWDVPESV